ncbi:TPA: hypothetical protein HA265_03200 [Candidatus Woesearchaeota archaeon]|nr:hypothetical protein [Candidatus Woesearchaeota archaeon]
MKQIRIAQTLLVLLMAIALSGIAYGQTCEGTLSAPTQQVYINAPWNITFFNGDLGSTGYNVTLNLPAAVSLTASTPNPLLVTGIVPDTEYKWEVSTPLAGVYTFNVTVTAPGGSSCTLTVNGTIDVIVPIPDPTLMVFVSNMNTLTLGQAYTEQVTVWNMGPGISYNTMGVASTSGGQAVSPVTWTAGTIGNNSGVDDSHTMQFTITPNACGSDDFTVYVMNYEDGEGNLMAPVYGSDGFTVIGTDIAFTSLTATNVLQGQDTQIDLTVQNIGTLNAAAVSVQIYVDGVLETTRNLGAIAQGASVSDTWTYNTGAKVVGNHNVTAQIVSAVECSSANNQAQAVFVVSSSGGAVCGNGIWEAGEQCDGADLNGQTCVSQGFTGGTLSCAAGTCLFNTSACTSPPAPFCGD